MNDQEMKEKIVEIATILPRIERKLDRIENKMEVLDFRTDLCEKEIEKLGLWKKIFIGLISLIGTSAIGIFIKIVV